MNFNGLEVSNRIIASTSFNYGKGYDFKENPYTWLFIRLGLMNINDFGAFITPTITVLERSGFYTSRLKPWKVIRMYPHKVLNRFGWNNCGIEKLEKEEFPKLASGIKKCIVSVGALKSAKEIFEIVAVLNDYDIAGIEINVSCHNVDLCFLENKSVFSKLFNGARKISRHPLIVKVNAEADYVMISKIAQYEGINLIHAINTTRIYSRKLGGYCGQSSYKNKKIALRVINELRQNGINIPIIGGSGIWTARDIKEYENVGANLFSMSHQFLYFPFWPGFLARNNMSVID